MASQEEVNKIHNDVYSVLHHVQKNLCVPKNQLNNFGKYKYRSCEDILEEVKKVLPDSASITLEDEIKLIGDWHYVCATATLIYKDKIVKASAYAREAMTKKGYDEAQITGAASSYARKYALSGLLLIDDSKDPDSKDNREQPKVEQVPLDEKSLLLEELNKLVVDRNIPPETVKKWKEHFKINSLVDLQANQIKEIISKVKAKS